MIEKVENSIVHKAKREWICSRCHKRILIGTMYARTENELLCPNEFSIGGNDTDWTLCKEDVKKINGG